MPEDEDTGEEPVEQDEQGGGDVMEEDDAGTEAQDGTMGAEETQDDESATAAVNPRYSLRPNRGRNYDHRLAQRMDDPQNSQSYDTYDAQYEGTQFVQLDDYLKDETTTLREAVMEMQSSGLATKIVQVITGFIDTNVSKSRNKETRKSRPRRTVR
jgi:hypothetical protein